MTSTFPVTDLEILFGTIAALLILEATRRLLGWLLVIVAVVALIYTYWGEHLPFLSLKHRVYTFEHMLDYMYLTDNGIWGIALGVAATYIVLFIIFGAFAEKAGIDGRAVVDVIGGGAAGSWQMVNRYGTMIDDKFEHGFAVDWMRKDLAICLATAEEIGAALPVTALVDQFYKDVQAMGGGRWDTSSLIRLLTRKGQGPGRH